MNAKKKKEFLRKTVGEDILFAEDVAELLCVVPDTIYRWVRAGELKCKKYMKLMYFTETELDAFLKRNGIDGN